MPRLVRAVPKYAKHKPTGQAVVKIGGVAHYLGPHGSDTSIAEYDRIIGEFLASGRNPVLVNTDQSASVVDVLAAFLEFASEFYMKNGKPTSELGAYKQVARSLKRLYGMKPAAEFGPLALKSVRETWIHQGLARKTVNQYQRRAVRIFKWAVAEEFVGPAVWQALSAVEGLRKGRTSAKEPVLVPPVSLETIQATIPHLSPIVADMIRMQLLTGMRPGEVCMLRPCDIDRSMEVWEFRPGSHKTEHHGRERVVYIGPQAKVILGPYLFRESEAACFSAAESREWFRAERAARRVTLESCGNARGRRGKRGKQATKPQPSSRTRNSRPCFDTSGYGQAIGYGCKKAWPVPKAIREYQEAAKAWVIAHRWAPNQIRHTRGTEIRKQFGLEAAQVILGHASADVTQIYAERDAEKARDVVRQIG